MGNYLWVMVFEDLKTTVMLFMDLGAICPVFGINLKSSLDAQLNFIVEVLLFLNEKVTLFYSPIMQSSKFILSSS